MGLSTFLHGCVFALLVVVWLLLFGCEDGVELGFFFEAGGCILRATSFEEGFWEVCGLRYDGVRATHLVVWVSFSVCVFCYPSLDLCCPLHFALISKTRSLVLFLSFLLGLGSGGRVDATWLFFCYSTSVFLLCMDPILCFSNLALFSSSLFPFEPGFWWERRRPMWQAAGRVVI